MSNDIRPAALAAARRGFAVFPCAPDSKRPRYGLKWPEAATSDPETVARCTWRPGENLAVAAKPSRLVIIDCDMPKPGYEFPPAWQDEADVNEGADVFAVLAERAGHPLTSWPPDTYTVRTPSGGWHLYYRAPAGRSIGNRPLGPLIDIRGGGEGNGGYVVAAGSVIGGRAYEVIIDRDPAPLPASIVDLLDPPRPHPAAVPRPASRPGDRVAARLEGLLVAVLDAQPGERNNVLHWAACRAAEMVAAGQLTTDQVHDSLGRAAARAGLNEGEAWRTIASALRQPFGRTA